MRAHPWVRFPLQEIIMGRSQSGIMRGAWNTPSCKCGWCEACEAATDPRYTQESTSSDYVRTKEQLAQDKLRDPKLSEGIAFREKI
jgi:hypothetical protein